MVPQSGGSHIRWDHNGGFVVTMGSQWGVELQQLVLQRRLLPHPLGPQWWVTLAQLGPQRGVALAPWLVD